MAKDENAGNGDGGRKVAVQRVKKAYEQVAEQLHGLIVEGQMTQGQRLPSEVDLARDFGVSRSTIREALRQLAAQQMIRTAKGPTGGSFVTLPSVDHISDFLSANIGLLSETEHLTLEEFLEVREVLEVPAARLAALRRGERALQDLHGAIPDDPTGLSTPVQFEHNKDFHVALVEASGNTLLHIATQPIFSVLQTNLARSSLDADFYRHINQQHRELLAFVEAGDAEGAAESMRAHLHYLRPFYERVWRDVFRPRGRVAAVSGP